MDYSFPFRDPNLLGALHVRNDFLWHPKAFDPIVGLLVHFDGHHLVKALVWFWLIDETLSANLVYRSDYEIGSTTPSVEANEDDDMKMVMPW